MIIIHFRLHRHLYYTNGIEWSASAMEMSVIAAKNVANMAYKDWKDNLPKNNEIDTSENFNEDKHYYKRQQLEL